MSAWNVWFHPRRSARALEELEQLRQQTVVLEAERSETVAKAEEMAAELGAANSRLEEQTRRAEFYKAKVKKQEERLLTLAAELKELKLMLSAERAETDAAINEINSRLGTVEKMKQSYEHRIAHLRHALHDAKTRLEARADYDALSELALIDLESAPKQQAPAKQTPVQTKKTSAATDPSDWLLPLPENE